MHHLFNGLTHEAFSITDSNLKDCILRIPTYTKGNKVLVYRDYEINPCNGFIIDIARQASHDYIHHCDIRSNAVRKYFSKEPIYAGIASNAAIQADVVICNTVKLIEEVKLIRKSSNFTTARNALVGLLFASIKSDGYVILGDKYFSARILFERHVSNFHIGNLVHTCKPYTGKTNAKLKLKQIMANSRPMGGNMKLLYARER